jgi:hypothetical protein
MICKTLHRKLKRENTNPTKHGPSSFMTYHRVCNYINTMGATSGAEADYPSGAPVFTPGLWWGSRCTLVLGVCFVDRCLSFCTFPFGHCVVCSSSICGFWLPLWYLQTLPRGSWSTRLAYDILPWHVSFHSSDPSLQSAS